MCNNDDRPRYLVPDSDVIFMTDAGSTAAVMLIRGDRYLLTHGAAKLIFEAWINSTVIRDVREILKEGMESAYFWIESQKHIMTVEQQPTVVSSTKSKIKAGEFISERERIKAAEEGWLTIREIKGQFSQNLRISWYATERNMVDCGIPKVPESFSITHDMRHQLDYQFIPSTQQLAAGNGCSACAACAICTICAEVNALSGIVGLVGVIGLAAYAETARQLELKKGV
jgi:hypothetical protein